MKTTDVLRNLAKAALLAFLLASWSCVKELEVDPDIVPIDQICPDDEFSTDAPEPVTITVTKSVEPLIEDTETKTSLSNGSVAWTSGDTFSVLGIGRHVQTSTGGTVTPLSYSDLNSMSVGQTKTVMITSVSSSGYKIGSYNSTWLGVANSNPGYRYAGKSISDAQASANEAQMASELQSLLKRSDAQKYQYTITRTSSGFTIKNSYGKYWWLSGSLKLSSNKSTFTFDQPTKTSSSTLIVKQNTGSSIVNPCLLRVKCTSGRSTYYLNSGSATPTLSTSASGGWTYFYIYSVGQPSSTTVETPFNNEFRVTNTSTGAHSGNILEGSTTNVAVYPYSADHSFDGTTVKVSVPQVQNYAANSFGQGAYPMIGVLNSENHISFQHMCGMLKLSIKGTSKVNSVSVSDNNANNCLWGTASISAANVASADLGALSFSGGDNTVTLNCGENGVQLNEATATVFYLVVPAGSFANGFTIKLQTPAGELTKIASKDFTISRSSIKSVSTSESTFEGAQPEETPTPVVLDTYNIMNDLARKYFDNVTYSTTQLNSGKSLFNISSTSTSYRPDQPKPVEVTWAGGSGNAVVAIYNDEACTSLFYRDTVSASNHKYGFSDLVPERTYYYEVTNGSTVLASGGFNTTGQVRMLAIGSSFNVRDIGGWTGLAGKKIQYEKVYRGGHLDDITTKEKVRLNFLGITGENDFRPIDKGVESTIFERENHSNCVVKTNLVSDHGTTMFFHKCTDNESNNILYTNNETDPKKRDRGAYVMHMAFVIDAVLSDHPTYFHCKSGADRTGVFGLLIEGLLGVDPGDIVKDYELTNFSQESGSGVSGNRKFSSTANIGKAYIAVRDNKMNAPSSYNTFQKRCYYYFNQCFEKKINASDLDAFIMKMLGMTEAEYAPYRPTNVYEGGSSNTLGSIYDWECGHEHGWN